MNRFALIAATGVLALTLTACEDHSAPKTTPVKTDNVLDKTHDKVEGAKKVHEENMDKQMDASDKAKESTGTTPVEPTTTDTTPSH